MKKKRKTLQKKLKFLILSLLLVSLLSVSSISDFRNGNLIGAANAQSQQEESKPHKQTKAEYKASIRAVKAKYRIARKEILSKMASRLEMDKTKSERIEIRKKYRSSLREAKETLDRELQETKHAYKKNLG